MLHTACAPRGPAPATTSASPSQRHRLSVTVCATQLSRTGDLTATVHGALGQSGLPAGRLVCESAHELVVHLGAGTGQGHLDARPAPAAELLALLAR